MIRAAGDLIGSLLGETMQRKRGQNRRAVFLDRDGVINEDVGHLRRIDDLRLLPGVTGAIRRINVSGYLAVVVTNQSVVARNLCSIEELERIHARLQVLLATGGAYLDAIYYCPHYPSTGEPGAHPEFEMDCECRKPKIGMIRRAQRDLDIDLGSSFLVGDLVSDIQCGRNAGLITIAVKTGKEWGTSTVEPDYWADDLAQAVSLILRFC